MFPALRALELAIPMMWSLTSFGLVHKALKCGIIPAGDAQSMAPEDVLVALVVVVVRVHLRLGVGVKHIIG